MNKSLCSCSACEELASEKHVNSANVVIWCLILFGVLFIVGCWNSVAHAQEYTDEQIVNAIYKAEGGKHAKKPYGIISVKCEGEKECRQICKNTVRNNKRRYKNDPKGSKDFIEFLSKRYAPIGASNDPAGLNRNWQRNVRSILAKTYGHKEA